MLLQRFPRSTDGRVLAEGDKVVARFTMSGQHRRLEASAPTQRYFEARRRHLKIVDSPIAEVRGTADPGEC
jgi:hypothetical protein